MITLFSEPQASRSGPSAFVVSILVHISVFALLAAKIIENHRIVERFPADRFAVRVLDFHSTAPQTRQAAGGGIVYRGVPEQQQPIRPSGAHPQASGGGSAGSPPVTRLTAKLMPAPQTLIQPDIDRMLVIPQKTPVPLVVLWSPEKTVVRKVVPAPPDKPAIALVRPTLDMPIKEENLADLRISSSVFVTQSPAAPPSTTSPVVVHGPEETKKVPQTTSKQPEQTTPARVLSLSDVRVAEGKVAVPMANQTASKMAPGTTIPGQLKDSTPAGAGSSASKTGDTGAGKGSGSRAGAKQDATASTGAGNGPAPGNNLAQAAKVAAGSASPGHSPKSAAPGSGPAPAALPASGAATGLAQGAAAGSGSGSQPQPGAVHISLPKDGQFGVVVVGSSIEDRYPETAELWSGRMASTVYLRVGLPKSWIMQYTLPRLVDASLAGGGHLEAPWPYEIVRPNLDPGDVDSDAVILHGFIDKDGRFEKLEVVFPTPLLQAPMVLNVLNQWQFRPAKVNGLLTAVEVLLIIPDQTQ